MQRSGVADFQVVVSAFRSALQSSIMTSEGPICGPSPKKALSGKMDAKLLKPSVIVSSCSSEVTITPSGTAPPGVTVDNRNIEVFCLSKEEGASINTSLDCCMY